MPEGYMKKEKLLLFFITAFCFNMAASFVHPVTPTLIVERQLDSSMFGVALAAMMTMNFLFSPFWGRLCAYVPTKLIMPVCSIGYAVGQLLFGSMAGAIVQLCVVASLTTFFHSYQDKQSMGWIFYTFLFIGLASTVFVQILYYVPFVWLMMQIQLASLDWRTFWASLIGLLTPYWFILPVAIYQEEFGSFVTHFEQLAVFQLPDYSLLTVNQVVIFAFVVTLALTGSIHYWRNSLSDKFRIRQLYGCFTVLTVVTIVFIVAQPQHFQALMHILIIATSPLIGHFLALTYTRITNYAFYVICAAALLITLLNLWMPSLSF